MFYPLHFKIFGNNFETQNKKKDIIFCFRKHDNCVIVDILVEPLSSLNVITVTRIAKYTRT